MQYVMNHPDSWHKLVVVDIAPRFYPVHHTSILKGMNLMPLAAMKSRLEAETFFTQYEDHPGTRNFILKNLARGDNGFTWRLNLPVLTREIETVGGELSGIRTINKPVLFLKGELSSYITDEDDKEIRRIFTDVRIETIAEAGHWIQAEQPQAFIEAVMKFIRG